MDLFNYIQTQIKERLSKGSHISPELDIVSQELIPSVLALLAENHQTTLETLQNDLVSKSDEEILNLPQIKRVLDLSIEKVCDIYQEEFTQATLESSAKEVIKNDVTTLLKGSLSVWENLKQKTYQEILNDAHAGSNEERVYLWLEEIKKGTGVEPETNETIDAFSRRALIYFLRNQK